MLRAAQNIGSGAPSAVMAGFVPAIHAGQRTQKDVDARVKPRA